MWNRFEKAAVVLGLVVFLALALYQLDLPGLHYDEAKEAGLPALQLLLGLPVEAFRGAGIWVSGQLIPLMVVDYIGATNAILALPFLAFGYVLDCGNLVAVLRLLPVTLSAISLLLLYWLALSLYNQRVALIAFFLLAVNPSFVFWSRQGIFVTSTIIPISLGAAVCLVTWYRRGSRLYLWIGMFLLGVGLYTKFLFLWIILAFALVFALFEGKRLSAAIWPLRAARHEECSEPSHCPTDATHRIPSALPYSIGITEIVGSIAAFVLGIVPLILYNLQTGGTFGAIGKNLTTSYYGIDNLAFFQNFWTRLGQLQAVLSGNHLWYLGGVAENSLWPYAALIALGVTVIAVVLRARDELRRAALPWVIWGVILIASCFTVSALWPTHYALLLPWPPLALAVSVDLMWRRCKWTGCPLLKTQRCLGYMAIAVGLLVGFLDLRVDLVYHQLLTATGGLSGHSSAIYDLADALDNQGLIAPVAMDWGFAAQIQFLTQGRIRPVEIFGYEWDADEGFKQRLQSFIDNPDSVYIFHTPAETVFPRREAFDAVVTQEGKVSATEKVLRQRDEKPIFTLVRVKPS